MQNNYKYDVVIILCGGLYKEIDGTFHPTQYSHSDEYGMLGGFIRVDAAAALYLQKKARTFCFSTGISEKQLSKFGPVVPSEAKIYSKSFLSLIAREKKINLYQNMPLVPASIILEAKSVNTTSNLQETLQISKIKQWENIAVLSSRYHIPRVRALYTLVSKQQETAINKVTFLSAEEVLKTNPSKKYNEEIAAAYKTVEAKKRIKHELQGLRNITDGTYILGEYQRHKHI